MPLFTNSSPFDADVEKATSELNAKDDMVLIKEVCDKVKQVPSGAKDCLRSIVRRMNHKVPHVALQALTLLDACVRNCGYTFHIEMASRDFVSECRTFITSGKPHPKAVQKLKMLIKRWTDNEFRSDSSLSIVPSMYNSLRSEGHVFPTDDSTQPKEAGSSLSRKEEDDIARAIAMSLKEAEKQSGSKSQSSLYPGIAGAAWSANSSSSRELRKVRTLYDFEAAEDNELTFKAGETISILDDSDPNWWKGSSWRGEGLFPANFVTADLTAEPEPEVSKARKSVHFQEEVDVKILESAAPEVIEIDEGKIDRALTLIQNADPTGENDTDPAELTVLEEQCKAMSPLIDQELEKIDRQHMLLTEYNSKLVDAFKMYHSLMSELPAYSYMSTVSSVSVPPPPTMQQQGMYAGPQYVTSQLQLADVSGSMATSSQILSYGSVTGQQQAHNAPSTLQSVYQTFGNHMSLNQPPPQPSAQPSFGQPSYQYATNGAYFLDAVSSSAAATQGQQQHYSSAPTGVESQSQPSAPGYIQMPLSAQNLL